MTDLKTEIFEKHRLEIERLCYRMLGTLSDAQDIVQDTYLKWLTVTEAEIQNPRAWLIKVASRLALNFMKSARFRRENYVGTWLPEPLLSGQLEASRALEIDESVSMALLVALEKLNSSERAVYLLRAVFAYSFDDIAELLGRSNSGCRQLATRARKRITESKPRFQTSSKDHRRLLRAFLSAAREGELRELEGLLTETAELYSDGGGKVQALDQVLIGAHKIAAFMIGVWSTIRRQATTIELKERWFNGAPGILVFEDGRLATAMTLSLYQGKISCIYAVRNPDKLLSLETD